MMIELVAVVKFVGWFLNGCSIGAVLAEKQKGFQGLERTVGR